MLFTPQPFYATHCLAPVQGYNLNTPASISGKRKLWSYNVTDTKVQQLTIVIFRADAHTQMTELAS